MSIKRFDEEERKDKYGRTPAVWVSKSTTLEELYDYLLDHYQATGYKFSMVFDCTKDEREDIERQQPVYYFDETLPEMVDYIGPKYILGLLPKICKGGND